MPFGHSSTRRMRILEQEKCPDCAGPLNEIKILDTESAITTKIGLFDLIYTVPDAKRSMFGV